MEEFIIKYFSFGAAVPFGYMFFLIYILLSSIWAIRGLIGLIVTREIRWVRHGLAVALLLLNGLFYFAGHLTSQNLDFNPFSSSEDFVGHWQDGQSRMVLYADGSAEFELTDEYLTRLGVANGQGYWATYRDFNLNISNQSNTEVEREKRFRIIKFRDDYRLIIEDYDDRDLWDRHLGFEKLS